MMNYQIQGPARVCAATSRQLAVGERAYSALFDEGGPFIRRDYSFEGWPGPPAGAFAWWVGRIPDTGAAARPPINDELLVDCFEHLSDTADHSRLNFRYVVALLLMRRKRFKFEDTRKQGDTETLLLKDAKTGRRHEVVDPRLGESEMDAVRDEVFHVLGWS